MKNTKLVTAKAKPRKVRPMPKHPQQTTGQVKKLRTILPKGAPTSGENAL